MKRIWFNHWFSTVYLMIEMLKQADWEYYIIGSNDKENAVYRAVCDEWYQEPVLSETEYIQYCLNFCREHRVDIFIPRRQFLSVSRHKKDFEALGVSVMVDDYDLIEPLSCKTKTYECLKDIRSIHIPPYFKVTNAEEFVTAYRQLKKDYSQVCFKFEFDEGGLSFRLIDDSAKGYASLFRNRFGKITFEEAVSALSEREKIAPLIVMPYLPGEEVSVDCLSTAKGRIMIPRFKGSTRTERISFQEDILKMCSDFMDRFPLQWPFNIQFKYLCDVPYLLEVNTRMSGGVPLACHAEQINILDIAVSKLIGAEKDWHLSKKETKIAYLERPLIITQE